MNPTRRTFIKHSALTLAGAALLPKTFFAAGADMSVVGVQLYSVRDDMKKAPLQTLQGLSKMGYKYVEHANYENGKFYGYAPKEFKKVLDDLGLHMHSGHTMMRTQDWDAANNTFTPKWKQTVEDAATVGQKFVISPMVDEEASKSSDQFKQFMDISNKCGELCKSNGLKFGYHNESFEFATQLDNRLLFDLIMENTDPQLVIHQLDIGNMYGPGGRAAEVIKKYPGRFALMHVKDEIKRTDGDTKDPYESTVLGKGVVGVKDVLTVAKKMAGTRYYIIEQESYQGQAPMDSVKEDLQIMKRWGYV